MFSLSRVLQEIRGEGLVARISNDYEPQLPVVGEDIPGPAVMNCLGTVRSLETVDQRASMVSHGFRLPCSDSDETDDDVLSVGPARPLVTAALLGGSGNSWTADYPYGMCCAQLDDFNWVIPAGDLVRGLPEPDLEVDSSDTKPNVYDVYHDMPDEFPVEMEATAVESLCSPVVVQTRPQGGCDPVVPLRMCQGHDFIKKISPEVVVSGRESIISVPDVCDEICVMPDQLPVVPKSAAVPLAASVVAQTRPRGGGGSNLLLPVDMSIEPLDDDGLDVIISGRESTVMKSDVSRDICVEPDQLPVVVSKVAVESLGLPGVAGRARRETFYSSGYISGRWTYGGGASSRTDRAFGSGKAPGRWTYGGDGCFGTVKAFGSGDETERWTCGGGAISGTDRAFGSGKAPGL